MNDAAGQRIAKIFSEAEARERAADDRLTRAVEAACKAHWASWDRMRPDIARQHRANMERAVAAALKVYVFFSDK